MVAPISEKEQRIKYFDTLDFDTDELATSTGQVERKDGSQYVYFSKKEKTE